MFEIQVYSIFLRSVLPMVVRNNLKKKSRTRASHLIKYVQLHGYLTRGATRVTISGAL